MTLNTTQMERYYNAPIGQVYKAIKRYLESNQSHFTLTNIDDLSCSCMFSSGINPTSQDENLTASAVPSGDGTLVRLTTVGEVETNVGNVQNVHSSTLTDDFFAGVSNALAHSYSVHTLAKPEDKKNS